MCCFTLTEASRDAERWGSTAEGIIFQQRWVSYHLSVVNCTGSALGHYGCRYCCGSLDRWEDTIGALKPCVGKAGTRRVALRWTIGSVIWLIGMWEDGGVVWWSRAEAYILIVVDCFRFRIRGIAWMVSMALVIIFSPFYRYSWTITFMASVWRRRQRPLLWFLQFDLFRKQEMTFVCISKQLLKWHKPSIINQLWVSKKGTVNTLILIFHATLLSIIKD